MKAGQTRNGSVSPFTNTRIENAIRITNRIVASFHLNAWPPNAEMKTSSAVARPGRGFHQIAVDHAGRRGSAPAAWWQGGTGR